MYKALTLQGKELTVWLDQEQRANTGDALCPTAGWSIIRRTKLNITAALVNHHTLLPFHPRSLAQVTITKLSPCFLIGPTYRITLARSIGHYSNLLSIPSSQVTEAESPPFFGDPGNFKNVIDAAVGQCPDGLLDPEEFSQVPADDDCDPSLISNFPWEHSNHGASRPRGRRHHRESLALEAMITSLMDISPPHYQRAPSHGCSTQVLF